MPSCAFRTCKNYPGNCKDKGITFHRFPRNAKLRAKWIAATGRKYWTASDDNIVCSVHFNPDDIRLCRSRYIMRKGAVPNADTQHSPTNSDRSTVYLWIRRWEETGRIEPYKRQNYDRATTSEQDAAIVAAHVADPFLETSRSAAIYHISQDTVRRRLKEATNKGRRQSKKNVLSTQKKRARVEKGVDSKKIKGELLCPIRWKSYSTDSDTWEPENTLSRPELINKFNDEENSKNKDSISPKKKALKRNASKKGKTPSKEPNTVWVSKKADEGESAEYENTSTILTPEPMTSPLTATIDPLKFDKPLDAYTINSIPSKETEQQGHSVDKTQEIPPSDGPMLLNSENQPFFFLAPTVESVLLSNPPTCINVMPIYKYAVEKPEQWKKGNDSEGKEEQDSTDIFALSIAEQIKILAPEHATILKGKIQSLINSYKATIQPQETNTSNIPKNSYSNEQLKTTGEETNTSNIPKNYFSNEQLNTTGEETNTSNIPKNYYSNEQEIKIKKETSVKTYSKKEICKRFMKRRNMSSKMRIQFESDESESSDVNDDETIVVKIEKSSDDSEVDDNVDETRKRSMEFEETSSRAKGKMRMFSEESESSDVEETVDVKSEAISDDCEMYEGNDDVGVSLENETIVIKEEFEESI